MNCSIDLCEDKIEHKNLFNLCNHHYSVLEASETETKEEYRIVYNAMLNFLNGEHNE